MRETGSSIAATFLSRLYGRQRRQLLSCDRSAFLTLVAVGDKRVIAHIDITDTNWLEQVDEAVTESITRGFDLFFGNGLRRYDFGRYGQGRQIPQELMSLGHLFAETDFASADTAHASNGLSSRGQVESALSKFSPSPDIIVCSGNGFHCYWLLEEPLWLNEKNFRQVKDLSTSWQRDFQAYFSKLGINGADSIQNLDRILRVPGTLNHKTSPGIPVLPVTL